MQVIKIPLKVMLDAMLDEMHLPKSASRTISNEDGTVTVSVMFFPSASRLEKSFGQQTFQSYGRTNARVAEDEAVFEALQYMECCERKMLKDYNYCRLANKQETNECLLRQLVSRETEVLQLNNSYGCFIQDVCGPSERIQKIIRENLSKPKNNGDHRINSILTELDKAASDLKQLTLRATQFVQPVGSSTYPKEMGFNEDAHDSDYSSY